MDTPKTQLIDTLSEEGLDASAILAADILREVFHESEDSEYPRADDELLTLRVGHTTAEREARLTLLDREEGENRVYRECFDGGARRWEFHACPRLTPRVLEEGIEGKPTAPEEFAS